MGLFREQQPNPRMIMLCVKNGDKEDANRELKTALELDPKSPGAEEAKDTLTKIRKFFLYYSQNQILSGDDKQISSYYYF
jgi:hypothetical protein